MGFRAAIWFHGATMEERQAALGREKIPGALPWASGDQQEVSILKANPE